jgi:restriction endonuclease S subunit
MKVIIPYLDEMASYLLRMFQGLEHYILRHLVKYGMTVHSLRYREFAINPLPIPSAEEQQEIVRRVDQLMNLCDRLETVLKEKTATGSNIWTSLSASA